ncbi:MAG: methyltransferase domain-containing protein [Tunicatimonas sp.]
MPNTTAWNPDLYTQKHNFVYQYGEDLVALLAPQPGECILDLGCGTGELTNQISEAGARVVGIDSSEELILAARKHFPQLSFHQRDATRLTDSEQYDAVFSNAVLHWISNQDAVSQGMFRALKPGGRLVIEFGGEGNVQQIREALKKTLQQHGYQKDASINLWYFPSIGQYTTLLEQHGFRVQSAHHYARPTRLADAETGIKDWLGMFANSYLEAVPPDVRPLILNEVQNALQPALYSDGHWYADYQRLRVTATKSV